MSQILVSLSQNPKRRPQVQMYSEKDEQLEAADVWRLCSEVIDYRLVVVNGAVVAAVASLRTDRGDRRDKKRDSFSGLRLLKSHMTCVNTQLRHTCMQVTQVSRCHWQLQELVQRPWSPAPTRACVCVLLMGPSEGQTSCSDLTNPDLWPALGSRSHVDVGGPCFHHNTNMLFVQ